MKLGAAQARSGCSTHGLGFWEWAGIAEPTVPTSRCENQDRVQAGLGWVTTLISSHEGWELKGYQAGLG